MAEKKEFEAKFWKSIRSDMTVMVSVSGIDPRPMTAQFDGERKTIYFFTASDTELAGKLARARKATLVYAAKKHDLFATVHGTLRIDGDRSTIDRLWNRFVAAWFERARMIRSSGCCGSNRRTPRSGSTPPASLPASRCSWAWVTQAGLQGQRGESAPLAKRRASSDVVEISWRTRQDSNL
jgi:general stress protein 26